MKDAEVLRIAAGALRSDAQRIRWDTDLTKAVAGVLGDLDPTGATGAGVARWLLEAAEICESAAGLPDAMSRVDAVLDLREAGGSKLQRATWEWVRRTILAAE